MDKFKMGALIVLFVAIMLISSGSAFYYFGGKNRLCNVREIDIYGGLYTNFDSEEDSGVISKDIVRQIEEAEKNDKIKAIIVSINSTGGSGVAAEEVVSALKNAKKPTAAFIRDNGKSAGYLVASGADKIFASKYSEIGGIAVTASFLEKTKYNATEGYTFVELASGKYKDMGNPDKPITDEEKEIVMKQLMIIHDDFVKDVATNRNLDIEKVKLLADGSYMMGQLAKDNGLIDELGGLADVKAYIEGMINETPVICESDEE